MSRKDDILDGLRNPTWVIPKEEGTMSEGEKWGIYRFCEEFCGSLKCKRGLCDKAEELQKLIRSCEQEAARKAVREFADKFAEKLFEKSEWMDRTPQLLENGGGITTHDARIVILKAVGVDIILSALASAGVEEGAINNDKNTM
jgi:hypothetical protein